MDGFGDQEHRDFMEFIINGIEAGYPEVVSGALVSVYNSISFISEPNNQEIQVNEELPSVSQGFDILTYASNNQHLLNSNLLHYSQGYEIVKQNSHISSYDNNISNINNDITMHMEVANTHEAFTSQVTCLNEANKETEQTFPLNSKLVDGFHEFDMSSPAIDLVPNNMLIASTIHTPNIKRNVSNDPMILEIGEAYKRARQGICEIKGSHIVKTCSEQGEMNYNFATNKSVTTNQMAFDYSRLADTYHELPNIKESHSHNQGTEKFIFLRKTIGLNIPSNIKAFRSPESETTLNEIPYSQRDDIITVPRPSGIYQNMNESNFSGEKFQVISPLERHSVEIEKEMLVSKFYHQKIAKHGLSNQGKIPYECYVCEYTTEEKNYYQMHMDVYRPVHYYCNVCKEIYEKKGSHDGERKCGTCGKYFLCKGLLEQHSEDHVDYYISYCRLCGKKLEEHIIAYGLRRCYKCCMCKFKNVKFNLQAHLHTHTDLSLFQCNNCGKRFSSIRAMQNHCKHKHHSNA